MRIVIVAISAMVLVIFAVACGRSSVEIQMDKTSASEPTVVISTPTALPVEPMAESTEPVATAPKAEDSVQESPVATATLETTAPEAGDSVEESTVETATLEATTTSNPESRAAPKRDLEIVTLLPPDAIPSIDNPIFFETLEKADAVYSDSELVLGVEIDGDARAYSVPLLSSHEIVNDTVAGDPIAVSW